MSRYSEAASYPITYRNAPLRRWLERGSVGDALRRCTGGTVSLLASRELGQGAFEMAGDVVISTRFTCAGY